LFGHACKRDSEESGGAIWFTHSKSNRHKVPRLVNRATSAQATAGHRHSRRFGGVRGEAQWTPFGAPGFDCVTYACVEVSKAMTEEDFDRYLDALGAEMRPAADLIIRLKKEDEAMPARLPLERKAKFANDKIIRRLEADFAVAFNRDDCFEEHHCPTG
jgi:hypothetical protein